MLPLGPINEKHPEKPSSVFYQPFPRFSECKITPFPTQKLPIGSNATAYRQFIFLFLNYLSILPTSSMNLANFFWHKAL